MTNRNEAQIVARIEELKTDLALNFKNICDLLVQLKSHYLHKDSIFRWYKEVAAGKLLPEAVLAFGTRRVYLQQICGYNRDLQKSLADGKEFDWATIEKGEIVQKRTSWHKMPPDAFKRMFPIGGPIRTVSEQKVVLQEQLATSPKTHINRHPVVRVVGGKMLIAKQSIPLSVILCAMREAGYDVTLPSEFSH
jgi:hypothetical protein